MASLNTEKLLESNINTDVSKRHLLYLLQRFSAFIEMVLLLKYV